MSLTTQKLWVLGPDILVTISNARGKVIRTTTWKGAAKYALAYDGVMTLSVPLISDISAGD